MTDLSAVIASVYDSDACLGEPIYLAQATLGHASVTRR